MAELVQIASMVQRLSDMHEIERAVFKGQLLTPLLHNLNRNVPFGSQGTNRSSPHHLTWVRLQGDNSPTIFGQRKGRYSPTRAKIKGLAPCRAYQLLDRLPFRTGAVAFGGREERIVIETRLYERNLVWLRLQPKHRFLP
jgi:hypothetical protein